MTTTYEFIAAACYSVLTDKEISKYAAELSKDTTFHPYYVINGESLHNEDVLRNIQETGQFPTFKTTGCEAADDLFLSAALLSFHGYTEQSQKTLKHAYYYLLQDHIEAEKLGRIEDIIKNTKQKIISGKPRNKNYNEAIAIAKATWAKYPAAGKGNLCRALQSYFNGGVSIDRLNAWIKKAGIQPPKPDKYTSFSLVIPSA